MSDGPTMELTEYHIKTADGTWEIAGGTVLETAVGFDGAKTLQIYAGKARVGEFFNPIGWKCRPPRSSLLSFEEGVTDALNARSQCGHQVSEAYKRGQEVGSELYRWRAVKTDIDNGYLELRNIPPEAPGQVDAGSAEIEIPEGFEAWAGGERPVCQADTVRVLYRSGDYANFIPEMETSGATWLHKGDELDIIAYRIIEASSQPVTADAAPVPGESEESRDQSDDDTPAEHISILTGDPAIEPESKLHAKAAIEDMLDDMVGGLSLSPDAVGTQTYMDGDQLVVREITADEYFAPAPENVTPEPDGYAPVTRATDPDADFWARGMTEQPKPQRMNPFRLFRRETEDA